MLDLFSGIGGFHKGFEQAGYKFDWVGFSEIDKYASAVYKHRFPKAVELGDITTIQPERDLPDHIDIICGGFPCQSFSVAGKRQGFDDTRGTLFFEIARILRHYRDAKSPIDYFVLENVKGLLSHDNGRTFATIYGVLTDLGYTVEFQLLNTRWWLPQNRERIYLVGYIGDRSGSKVFPIGETDVRNSKLEKQRESDGQHCKTLTARGAGEYHAGMQLVDVIDKKGNKKNNQHYAANLSGGGHSGGNHSDMDLIKIADYRNDEGLRIRKDGNSPTLMTVKHSETEPSMMPPLLVPGATKKGYAEAEEGDSINLSVPNSKTRRGRVGKGEAQTLDTGMQQYTIQPVLTPNRAEKRQNGRRFKEDGEDMFTLTGQDQHGVMIRDGRDVLDDYNNRIKEDGIVPTLTKRCGVKARRNGIKIITTSSIRRLTPVECCRLQGFPDDWNEFGEFDGKVVPMSDTQRYKQCGNAVTVNVVQAVAESIIKEK